MTEQELRAKYVTTAQKYIGCKESDGSHKKIIDLYNAHKPKGYYIMQYTDAWCDCFVSAMAAEAGLLDIIPMECSCSRHINLFKGLGVWEEDESITPQPGDLILYDWQDGTNYATTDNQGAADHIGIVEVVNGSTITAIEGNASNSVKRLGYKINGRYLRGFARPNFAKLATEVAVNPSTPPASSIITPGGKVTASQSAKSVDKTLSGTYRVTAKVGLHIRDGVGTNYKSFMVLPLNTDVKNYGFFNTDSAGDRWMYVQVTYNGVVYTGYCHGSYLTKLS